MPRDVVLKHNYSWWKWGDNFTTFKNYTRCYIMIFIAYDEFKLDRLSLSLSSSKEAGVGFEWERHPADMSFIIPNIDRIRTPCTIEKMINHGKCKISVFMISPQQYSNDLTKWKALSKNIDFNARKYNYHVLKDNEKICTPPLIPWKP